MSLCKNTWWRHSRDFLYFPSGHMKQISKNFCLAYIKIIFKFCNERSGEFFSLFWRPTQFLSHFQTFTQSLYPRKKPKPFSNLEEELKTNNWVHSIFSQTASTSKLLIMKLWFFAFICLIYEFFEFNFCLVWNFALSHPTSNIFSK